MLTEPKNGSSEHASCNDSSEAMTNARIATQQFMDRHGTIHCGADPCIHQRGPADQQFISSSSSSSTLMPIGADL